MRTIRVFSGLLLAIAFYALPDGAIQFSLLRLPIKLENHPTPRKYLIETMAGGVAAFDYDGDGLVDLFFTNGASVPSLIKERGRDDNHLFHNEGDFKFRDVTAQSGLAGQGYSIGVAVADYDNDDKPDLFVAGVNGNHLYHNDGNGRFSDVTAQAGVTSREWSVAAAWMDYDRDGLLDLFVVNYVAWSPESNPVCTETPNAIPVYCHPRKFKGLANRLFHNVGNGRFEDVSETSGISGLVGKGMSAVVADYDVDGFPDIFVTNDGLQNFLFRNLQHGNFEEVALDAGIALTDSGRALSGMGTDFRDYDNDGRPDVVFTALAGETFPLFRNLGGGIFQDNTYTSRLRALTIRRSGWGVSFGDFDNDGWKDLISANSHVTDNIASFSGDRYELPNSLFRNLGGSTFEDVSASVGEDFAVARAHRGLAVADLDNDGRLDAVVSVLGESPEIWHNITRTNNHWIEFRLTGRRSNRDGLGAQIRVGDQVNTQTGSVGYASGVLGPVHFGLGSRQMVPRVEITWPDGQSQVLSNVHADRILQVSEP
jgi:hypothetical protein